MATKKITELTELTAGQTASGDLLFLYDLSVTTLKSLGLGTLPSELDGDILDIDFTPTYYTPSTTPAEASDVDDLAAHLYGIDQFLGKDPRNALTTDTTLTAAHRFVEVETSGGNVTVTLASAATVGAGHRYIIKVTDATASCIIATNGSETIDGADAFALNFLNEILEIISDGTNWQIIRWELKRDIQRPKFMALERVAYTSGSEEPSVGDQLDGATSAKTAIVYKVELASGTWGGGDAAGNLFVYNKTGAWQAEDLDINGGTANVMSIAADAAADSIGIEGFLTRTPGGQYEYVYLNSAIAFIMQSTGSNASSDDYGADGWHYIFIDDSAVDTQNSPLLDADCFRNETTAPTWDQDKKGWYTGADKCIFAVYETGSEILEFFHDGGDLVMLADNIVELALTDYDAWTDITLGIPIGICNKALITAEYENTGASGTETYMYVRTNGQTATVGHKVGGSTASSAVKTFSTFPIYTDTAGKIEVTKSASTAATLAINLNGFYFPIGM